MEDAFAIPIFLYQAFYMLFSSAIPLLLIIVILGVIVKSGKKLIRTIFN